MVVWRHLLLDLRAKKREKKMNYQITTTSSTNKDKAVASIATSRRRILALQATVVAQVETARPSGATHTTIRAMVEQTTTLTTIVY